MRNKACFVTIKNRDTCANVLGLLLQKNINTRKCKNNKCGNCFRSKVVDFAKFKLEISDKNENIFICIRNENNLKIRTIAIEVKIQI